VTAGAVAAAVLLVAGLGAGGRLLVRGEECRRRRRGLLGGVGGAGGERGPAIGRWVTGRLRADGRWREPGLLVLPLGIAAGLACGSPVPVLGALAGAGPLVRALRRRRAEQGSERCRAAVAELSGALAAELRAGATPDQALLTVAAGGEDDRPSGSGASGDGLPVLPDGARSELLAAARYCGDVPAALRRLALSPGAEGAAGIAACWELSAERGAGLAAGLDRVAEGLRAERARYEAVRAELAGPRSTAALLAGLPVFGLALGTSLGAQPLRILLHTGAGLVCLGLGAGLEWAGLAWTARLVRTAQAGC
jgi:tight adherence protein B